MLDQEVCNSTCGSRRFSHGITYQKLWFLLFLKRAVDSGYPFHLGMEIGSAAGFDDIVFRYEQNGKIIHRFIQVKHKRNGCRRISIGDLLTRKKKSEFGLIKYCIAYLKIKDSKKFPTKDPRYFIIATNIGFDFESLVL